MASGPELVGRLGLDKSNYARGLSEAEKDFQNFTRRNTAESRRFGGEFAETFHGAHKILRAFGAVAVFRELIEGFKSVSEWADKFGDKTDQNVAAASRWGKAWASSIDVAKSGLASVLGYLTRAGEYVGGGLKGESADETDRQAAQEDAAIAAEDRAAALKKANPKAESLRQQIDAKAEDQSVSKMNNEEKIAHYQERNLKNVRDLAGLDDTALDYTTKQLEIKKKIQDTNEAIAKAERAEEIIKQEATAEDYADIIEGEKMDAERAKKKAELDKQAKQRVKEDAAERTQLLNQEAAVELRIDSIKTRQADRSKLTLQELSKLDAFDPNVSLKAGQQGAQARQVQELDDKAEEARQRGDIDTEKDYQAQSKVITDALHGPGGLLKSTDHPDDEMNLQLEEANRQLVEINAKLKGKFTAEE